MDIKTVPEHIAIIMDGNGRWANKRMLSRKMGHKAGAETLKKIVEQCQKLKIKHLTVYAFSTENWSRPKDEVDALMDLLRNYIKQYINDTNKNNIKIDVIGDTSKLPQDIQKSIDTLYEKTKCKDGINLHIALNYGGRDDIVRAVKRLGADLTDKKIDIDSIDENLFNRYLDTSEIPDPELLIRTSGEQRLSNFLLWQLAYCEFYFTPKLWPDFDSNELLKALEAYQNRDRRFGSI